MKGILRAAAILIFVCCFVTPLSALEKGDTQVWYATVITIPLSERWKLGIREEFRLGEDVESLAEQFTEPGLTCSIVPWLSVGMDYRHVYKKKSGLWNMEKRPQWNATLKYKRWGIGFQDRSRLERRVLPDADDAWRYRNKLALVFPASLTAGFAKPCLAGEVFLDADDTNLSRYRLFAGFKGTLTGRLGFDVSYMLQASEKGDDWIGDHIVIAMLKLSL